MRNYAVPDQGACPGPGDVDALIAFFRRHDRIPRLEYIEDSAPRAWPALAAAGFALERRITVMTATPDTPLTPHSPAGTTFRQASIETDLMTAATVQHHAYQEPGPPGPQDITRLTRLIQRGGIIAIAVDDASGTVTGAGLVDVTADCAEVGALAGVGVLTAFRRRGIASALSAYLARTAHPQGISLVFLEAEPAEEQIYRRTGFIDATAKIWASIRSAAPV
jgi:GNAT superfamily N-acetyltransferase